MVVVSEATMIYNMRIVPSYISSNGYYGYVPPVYERVKHRSNYQQVQFNNQQKLHHDELQVHDQENIRTTHGHGISLGTSSHRHQYNEQHYDYNKPSAMETDGDEKTYFEETYRCQNNHCVISETTSRLVNGNGGVHLFDQTITNNNNNNVTISQRESRKRNSYDDPVFLPDYGIGQMKKSRQETVVTAKLSTVQGVQGNSDRPRCLMSHHHYA
ncbi:hypothetical protein PV328_001095 [Microctonus aethiopoides]|uniref:Uncharacterized protein n=1 Tax=Microctonus aethiopoides TaxID=144406 RepID=A0AA39FW76_9HYME|nr:hypothetical protein PV328_001095 [Microctonus aethiopoides]